MSIVSSHESGDFKDGVVQLRFSDDAGNVQDINASELAEVLQGLVEFTSDMARSGAFGDGIPPEVRVRPPKEGSFIVEAVLAFAEYAQTNPVEALTGAMTAGGALVQGLNVGIKKLKGDVATDFEPLANGQVKIKWRSGQVSEVSMEAWRHLNAMPRKTQRAMRKIMTPLNDESETLEVRHGSSSETTGEVLAEPADLVVTRVDYRNAATETDEITENVKVFNAEAQLTSIDFRPGEKWRIKTLHGTRLAAMDDEDFARQLDRGMALHKNDIFDVKIRENQTTKNGRTTKEWSLIEVTFRRRGDDDGHDEFPAEEPRAE